MEVSLMYYRMDIYEFIVSQKNVLKCVFLKILYSRILHAKFILFACLS